MLVAASLNSHEIVTDGYESTDTFLQIRSISDREVHALGERMHRHVESSRAWPEGSFLKDAGRVRAK